MSPNIHSEQQGGYSSKKEDVKDIFLLGEIFNSYNIWYKVWMIIGELSLLTSLNPFATGM